jgi:hypothetical protein
MTRRLPGLLLAGWLLVGCGQAPTAAPPTAAPTLPPATPTSTAAPPTTAPPPTSAPTAQPTVDPVRAALDAPLSDIGYQVPLIVRHVTAHAAVIEFELDGTSTGRLIVAPGDGSGPSASVAFDGTGGLFTVPDLGADVSYSAAVVLGTDQDPRQPHFLGDVWGEVTFRTQPETPAEFSVAVVGDSGFGGPATADLAALMATYGVDFTLHTGDLVYNLQDDPSPPAGYRTKLFSPFAPLLRSAPFYPSLGNHDLEPAAYWNGSPYDFRAFPPFVDPAMPDVTSGAGGWYAFEQRGVQFVILNSQVAFGYPGRTDETNWLADRLADPRFTATIVVLHVPVYNAGYHILDSLPVRKLWGDMLQSSDVPLVLSGHDHNYQRFDIGGRAYVISGGGSVKLYRVPVRDPSLMASAQTTHFTLLTFGANSIRIQAIDLSGQVFDDAQIPWSGWN